MAVLGLVGKQDLATENLSQYVPCLRVSSGDGQAPVVKEDPSSVAKFGLWGDDRTSAAWMISET